MYSATVSEPPACMQQLELVKNMQIARYLASAHPYPVIQDIQPPPGVCI